MKAVIPAAGLGTRFLPATKAQPKEMLPLIDKPIIQFVVEEAVDSGIDDILIITGRGKRAIEDHFDKSFELEQILEQKGRYELLRDVQNISDLADIHYIRQPEALGLGHAVYCAKKHVGDDSFVVLLGDDVIFSETPCSKQLMDCHEEHNGSVIAVHAVGMDMIEHYGVIDGVKVGGNTYEIKDLVEKPRPKEAPSNLAIIGRYLLAPEIFNAIEKTEPGKGGEIQLTDAIKLLSRKQRIYATEFDGERYDLGNKEDYIRATIQYALRREEFRDKTLRYMRDILGK